MFTSKSKIPKPPNGAQSSSTGLPTSNMTKPPALPLDQLELPMPDYLGTKTSKNISRSNGTKPGMSAHSQAQGLSSHSQAQGLAGEYPTPDTWGWGSDRKKPSFFSRLFGRGVEWDESMYGYPDKGKKGKGYKIHRPFPTISDPPPEIAAPPLMPNPYKMPKFVPHLPEDFDYLPRSIQKAIFKENEKREREWKKKEKEQEKLYKISMKEWEREEKERMKFEKRLMKEKEKEALWHYRHPPQPDPSKIKPKPLPHSHTYPIRKPPAAASSTNYDAPELDRNNPYNFMLLPATEFGVRRPFNPMIGGNEKWPNMSRTMTHAILDMNREEQIHAYHAGLLHSPNW
ncbi:hypothetical protein I302_109065 [Kwoniella bestiolae CBS 10118]|uniref:Uncharacterized protein n=1 Tax=Kwoniella bestiolae CBS 10118 TaxID=1296100 RepID=A0A1B9FUW3_9TREE|nr:hypothetical protein I302_08209 [Kwoniella bestiolae CBS 10118]OCF22559.1 hypothetical protein I302_08209 [Kwoniella bestiolae CBS 10118]